MRSQQDMQHNWELGQLRISSHVLRSTRCSSCEDQQLISCNLHAELMRFAPGSPEVELKNSESLLWVGEDTLEACMVAHRPHVPWPSAGASFIA